MSIAGDFAVGYLLHRLVDSIEPPFSFIGARHVSFVYRDNPSKANSAAWSVHD